jgi:hypothetical protein
MITTLLCFGLLQMVGLFLAKVEQYEAALMLANPHLEHGI